MQRLSTASTWSIAIVLGYASVDKLFNYRLFIKSLGDYPFISDQIAQLIAMPLILVELAIAVALLVPQFRRPAAACAGLLFALFGAVYVFAAYSNMNITCGCWFMLPAPPSPTLHAALNAAFTGMAVLAAKDGSTLHTPIARRQTSNVV